MDHLIADIDEIGAREKGYLKAQWRAEQAAFEAELREAARDMIDHIRKNLIRPPGCGDGEGRDESSL